MQIEATTVALSNTLHGIFPAAETQHRAQVEGGNGRIVTQNALPATFVAAAVQHHLQIEAKRFHCHRDRVGCYICHGRGNAAFVTSSGNGGTVTVITLHVTANTLYATRAAAATQDHSESGTKAVALPPRMCCKQHFLRQAKPTIHKLMLQQSHGHRKHVACNMVRGSETSSANASDNSRSFNAHVLHEHFSWQK